MIIALLPLPPVLATFFQTPLMIPSSPLPLAPLALPRLVLPHLVSPCAFTLSLPECPLLVSRTSAATVAVFCNFVTAVVANVIVAESCDSRTAGSEKKMSAAPGAGTETRHVFASVSQSISSMRSSPTRRPSDAKVAPNV